MPFTRYFGVFNPDELAILQKAFDRLCIERLLSQKDMEQREALAAEVVRVFQQGATVEAEIWQELSDHRQSRSGADGISV
ncbi:RNA-binding protein [Mesorhizobium sp. LHD-90]|uniref:RNA-binding protein n=1 Tax=Mesorhizobium sp. LHD-90 TaxID=3071414 RepID=UPI0027DEB145|nr:RNA-binding protein [Mesorhizobium sp. LHD-90]MDQ6436618.1 RNA-binding protein [Mesorhizobium sp. LHD-90]